MDRRDVLRVLAAGAGIQCLGGLSPEDLIVFGRRLHAHARSGAIAPGLRVLANHAATAVTAAAERILPRSDTPGATDAGVTAFIDHMLAEWYLPAERDRFLAGLDDLDARSRALGAQDFVSLTEAGQVSLLTEIDGDARADHWFATLKFLTVWGYFTSEVTARRTLGEGTAPGRYDGCAPYQPRTRRGGPA